MKKPLTILLPLSLMAAFLVGGMSQRTQARPLARYALACVGTETGGKVNFQVRWGSNDSWVATSVNPGKWKVLTHQYDYPGENKSPQLQIRFDDDLSNDSHMVIVDLNAYASRLF